jgi:mannose-6-phosphate isomerase-like protein (cupin superfamily)
MMARTMKKNTLRFRQGFRVVFGNRASQTAEMVLPLGAAEGDPRNRHRGADQWLFVVSGTGVATVNGRRHRLREGTLVLIARRDRHEIRNTGRGLLRTLNVYVPPAYTKSGGELPRGKR